MYSLGVPPTPLLSLRVADETKARWKAAAAERGYSLSELVHASVESSLKDPRAADDVSRRAVEAERRQDQAEPRDTATSDKPARKRSRSAQAESSPPAAGLCEHRVALTSYCGRCAA